LDVLELKDILNSEDFKSKEKGIDPYARNAIEKVGLIKIKNVSSLIKYNRELRMLGKSLRHKSKCIYWACRLSELTGYKNFQDLTEEDIQKFAVFYNNGEIESDRKHHWIGTYNQAQIHVIKFLKFVFYPNLPHKKRPRPEFLVNYDQLPRREDFIYDASDMWSDEDHAIYLKYCSGYNIERDRALHMVFHDTSARPLG